MTIQLFPFSVSVHPLHSNSILHPHYLRFRCLEEVLNHLSGCFTKDDQSAAAESGLVHFYQHLSFLLQEQLEALCRVR